MTAWPVGGGAEPIAIAARIIDRRARGAGDVAFDAVSDVAPQVCVAKIDTPSAALVDVTTADSIVAGSSPGRLLRPARSGALAPSATYQGSLDATLPAVRDGQYRVIVRTEKNFLGSQEHPLPIIPGMVATVEILTGKKTVLDYLIKPARLLRDEALREH